MKKVQLSKRNKILLILFAMAVIVGIICAVVNFTVKNAPRTSASAYVLLSYENASDGVDPDGHMLYAETFITDEVLEKALESQGLTGKYDAAEIRKSLVVSGAYPKNMLRKITSYDSLSDTSVSRELTKSNYYPIKYTLTLYDDFDGKISKKKLDGLLGAIKDEYVKYFTESYSEVFNTKSLLNVLNPESYDYVYALDVYEENLQAIRNYAQTLYSKHEDFVYNGVSFRDIVLRCDNIVSNDISKIDSNISLNALSNNVDMLKCYYEYKIRMLNLQLDAYNKDLQTVSKTIASYEKDATVYISTGDTIMKIDGNSSETYDQLVAKQLSISANIASAQTQVADCTRRLNNLTATSKEIPQALLESDLADLKANVSSLEASLNKLVEGYNEKYVNDSLIRASDVTHSSGSVFSMAFAVELVKCCGPFCMLVIFAWAVLCFFDELKRTKKKA